MRFVVLFVTVVFVLFLIDSLGKYHPSTYYKLYKNMKSFLLRFIGLLKILSIVPQKSPKDPISIEELRNVTILASLGMLHRAGWAYKQ